jgi:murein DD-endopeptidase MepM/ murein hydrolase activator NlpD
VTVVVLVVIVVIALIAASPLGVFFSNESGGEKSMNEVITELSGEYYAGIEQIEADNPHDEVRIDSSDGMLSIYWEQVLAVFSVKTSQDPENPLDVITMDDAKQDMLRAVLSDMYLLSHSSETTTVEQEVTTTNEDGEEVTETVTVSYTILTIHLVRKTPDEMAAQYGFTRDQKLSLAELMDDYYSDMWGYLLGGYTPGGGMREPSKERIPTGIFSWPLESAGTITSFFGWREDPFTGEQTYHGGIDISVPNGTPILAAADGMVTVANVTDSYGGGWGYYVKINHNATYDTLYAHCSSIAVRRGEQVKKAQVIAYVGNTGRSTGDHLHWEVYVNGERDDALNYFR